MAAFRLAWEQGADAIETDLRLTADGRLVACHDTDGRRTLGDARAINSLTLAEVRTLDAGRWKHRRWTGERVPSLEEILASLPHDKQIVLEIKEDAVDALERELPASLRDRAILIAFAAATIAKAKRHLPECRALWLCGDCGSVPQKDRGASLARLVRDLGIDGIDLRHERRLTANLLAPLREDGHAIFVYTVNHRAGVRRCAELGVDGITTDRPERARHWLGISA